MALSASTLSSLIKTNIKSAVPSVSNDTELDAFCTAIANAIVSHITGSAVVTVSVTATGPDPQGGVVSSSGTGTGTVA